MIKRTLLIISILIVIGGSFFLINDFSKEEGSILFEDKTGDIKAHYNEIVKVNKTSDIYLKEENEYVKAGTLEKDFELTLNEIKITNETKYFEFTLENNTYYIEYENVEKLDTLKEVDTRYKNYVLFNENIKSEESINLYQDETLMLTLSSGIDKAIVRKDDGKYYVEYNNDLYYVLEEEVTVYENNNTDISIATDIPATLYHFMYKEEEYKDCMEIICHSETQVRSHFDYLKENNYFTMTTKEMEWWIDGKINVQENSILITIDDAAWHQNWNEIVTEYEINVTYFLVTSWIDLENITTPYIEMAAHTHAQHNTGVCPGGQGSPMKCEDKNVLLEDLALNRSLLNNTDSFAYPFFEYNDYTIEVLKEAGFKTAYRGSMTSVTRGVDKFKIPRITMFSYTTMNEFINYIN